MRLPIRVRLTVVFAVTMAVLLAVGGTLLYVELARSLLHSTDNALRAQASSVEAGIGNRALSFADQGRRSGVQTFAQVLRAGGGIQESSGVVAGRALLSPAQLRSVTHPFFMERRIRGVSGTARVLVVPVSEGSSRAFVVVGASLAGRSEILSRLMMFLFIGGPVTLALASAAGWRLAGGALSPIERMRREATAISVSEPERRLPVTGARDEVSRLGSTLNSMLDRLQRSFARERLFVDEASHELRTPLAVLKTELELGLSRARTPSELKAALQGALSETDRLTELADDLLVYAREQGGRVPLHRSPVRIDRFLRTVCAPWVRQGEVSGIRIETHSPHIEFPVDENRLRQAIDNVMSNAIRHTPPSGRITVTASADASMLTLVVDDTGSGFAPEILHRAFEPFARGSLDRADPSPGSGLGLAIVRAVAEGHGGRAEASNRPDGARVSITLQAA